MGICVEKIRHDIPTCGHNALQVFQEDDGSYNGWCFACGTFVPNPYSDPNYKPAVAKRKTDEEIDEEASEVYSLPDAVNLPARKLKATYLNHYGVKLGVSRADGVTPAILYRPYYNSDNELVAYKAKVMETKQTWWISKGDEVMPFGWQQAINSGAKNLIITEGEEDAIALFQAIKESNIGTAYEKFDPAVVSIPHGAGCAAKYLAKISDHINRNFKGIVLVFDQDEPGRKGAEAVCKTVFSEAKVASLPAKDANACLIEGREKALVKAVQFQASVPKRSTLVWGRDLHEKARVPAQYGVSWPWEGLTKITRGIRTGEVHYIGAGQKMGKSEIVDAIGEHLMEEHGWKILVAKPEQNNLITYKKLAGKVVGKVFTDPNIQFEDDAYDKAGELLGNQLCMINLYQHLGWASLKEDIKAAVAEGVKAVFIDPITNLTNGMDSASANTHLQEVAQELSSMALDLDIVIFIMCHLRNPDGGPEHTLGGKVLTSQFAGSRAMGRSANYIWGIEGNKDESLPEEQRNLRDIVLIDDREFGEVGRCRLYWQRINGLFTEVK